MLDAIGKCHVVTSVTVSVDFFKFAVRRELTLCALTPTAMASLADFILAVVPYRLPKHLYSYEQGVTPLSTNVAVGAAIASYLAAIFGIQAVMKSQKQPLKLTTLFQIHNVILSSGSLLLLVLMLEEIIPIAWKHGLHYALCNENAWSPVRWPTISTCHFRLTPVSLAHGILLYGQLFLQVSRVRRHHLPCSQEEATPCVPHSTPLATWAHF